jgi:hypothetical protein
MAERQKSLFYKKIKCHCGQFYKSIREKNKVRYVCSGYANYRVCKRNTLDETLLIEMMSKRGKSILDVSNISVDQNGNIEISYNESENKNSQIISDKLIRF